MEIFDKRFVHFMWDDELEGKKCFIADHINILQDLVEQGGNALLYEVKKSDDANHPFQSNNNGINFAFAYYDPNHSIKKAFNEGKTIQYQSIDELNWRDVENEESFEQYLEEGRVFRIKPENEKKWIVYLNREIQFDGKDCYLTACREDRWESVQKDYGAKTKLFIGSESEVLEWFKAREKFAEVIKAWEDGKQIQVTPKGTDKWIDLHFEPTWDLRDEYRVKPEEEMKEKKDEKPECPCEDDTDSKACVGCDKSSKKEYKPYETVHEFIQDYQDRFPTTNPRPCYTLPFIWLRNKNKKDERELVYCFRNLVIKMDNTYWDMNDLFNQWEYLDGSPCGMEVKE